MRLAFTIMLQQEKPDVLHPIYVKAKEIAIDVYEAMKNIITRVELEEKLIYDPDKKDFILTPYLNFYSTFLQIDYTSLLFITRELQKKHDIHINIVR